MRSLNYDLTQTTPVKIVTGDVLNVPYSGDKISIELPGGRYTLEVWGAQGGYRSSSSYGGKGGYAKGTIDLQKPTEVFLYAGGSGNSQTASGSSPILTAGGFNGGGSRYRYCGGGGASDIRIGQDSLYARVIVAGGGGSDGATNKTGMYGGGETGGSATQSYGTGGDGGTQTAGGTGGQSNDGTFGQGGNGLYRSSGYAGAGGGGWYGGGGSYPDSSGDDDRGGGGGSGYVYTSGTAGNYPSGCLLNSSHYLTDTQLTAGNASFTGPTGSSETGHAGNGYARITVLEVYPTTPEAPPNLRQTTADYFSLSIAWDAVECNGYKIYRDSVLIKTQTGTSYTDTDVVPNGCYVYKVLGYNAEGDGEPSEITAKTLEAYVATIPIISTAQISPQIVATSGSYTVTVSVTETTKVLLPEQRFSGEFYAGEV